MIDTDKYEGHTDDYIWTWKQYASHFDHDADRALIQDAPLLLEEVKRLREENNRYLDFILWLGVEHKGKKLAWEYGDEKIAEMIE
mgnify:CR=1 FL=1